MNNIDLTITNELIFSVFKVLIFRFFLGCPAIDRDRYNTTQ
jgi:hypothetical protein